MDDKNEGKLLAIAPLFFQNFHADPKDSYMAFGIDCGDGWYIPLMSLAKKIRALNLACQAQACKIVANQIKQKFGQLRVYYSVIIEANSSADKDFLSDLGMLLEEAINIAENECWHTCEVCGQRDGKNTAITSTTEAWIKRMCSICHAKRQNCLYIVTFSH